MTGFLLVRNVFFVCKMLLLSVKLHLDLNYMWPAQVPNFKFGHRVRILLITLASCFSGTMCIVIGSITVFNKGVVVFVDTLFSSKHFSSKNFCRSIISLKHFFVESFSSKRFLSKRFFVETIFCRNIM